MSTYLLERTAPVQLPIDGRLKDYLSEHSKSFASLIKEAWEWIQDQECEGVDIFNYQIELPPLEGKQKRSVQVNTYESFNKVFLDYFSAQVRPRYGFTLPLYEWVTYVCLAYIQHGK